MEVAEHRGVRWNEPGNSQERHRRFKTEEHEIVRYAEAWGRPAAMQKWDIRCETTMDRIVERVKKARGNGHEPIFIPMANTRESYPDSDSYYDGMVRALARHLREQDDKNALLWLAWQREREARLRLEEEKRNWRLTAKGKEEVIVGDILRRINQT